MSNLPHLTRRQMIAASAAMVVVPSAFGQDRAIRGDWVDQLVKYLESCAKPDGGYGWFDQDRSHLTPTNAVIGTYQALGLDVPRKARLIEFVRTGHPLPAQRQQKNDLPLFYLQQAQALKWLDDPARELGEKFLDHKKPTSYPRQYETHGYPILKQELTAVFGRALLDLPMNDLLPDFAKYLLERRRANGSYNNTPAADGSDGHIINTVWALWGLAVLRRGENVEDPTVNWLKEVQQAREDLGPLIEWLQSCQLPSGGFTWQPNPPIGAVDDVAYTWAAAQARQLMGFRPKDRDGVIAWLWALRNDDGGFGDRPGWPSNPVATYYAVDALAAWNATQGGPVQTARRVKREPVAPVEFTDHMKVFSALIEAHGRGSPADAVELARGLRIDLWGAKNAHPGWIARAQQIADQRKVPVTFFVADEEYGTLIDVPGLGTYSHISDLVAPADGDIGPSIAGREPHTWDEFEQKRIEPLEAGGGRLVWQFGENEEYVRILLDESIITGKGYKGLSTFHFGNPDFTDSQPFLYRFCHHIPFIGQHDAHGAEPWWWADQVTGYRTLFVAKEPTYAALVDAMDHHRVAAARFDDMSGDRLRMHGRAEVLDFIRDREEQWRWWGDARDAPDTMEDSRRPLASLVPVTPGTEFEAAVPGDGVNLRVRCQWVNTKQGLPKTEVVRLLVLLVDGELVQTQTIEKRSDRGPLSDHYYVANLPSIKPGEHEAELRLKALATGKLVTRKIAFTV